MVEDQTPKNMNSNEIYENIYLFGAGASFGTHPTIEQFSESVREALRTPDNLPFEDFIDLLERIEKHKTPDNYAKFLYQEGGVGGVNNDYDLIKDLYDQWINFFSGSNFYPGPGMEKDALNLQYMYKEDQELIFDEVAVDSRYLRLLKKLLKNQNGLEKNLFYTWNYDLSVEYSLRNLKLSNHIEKVIHLNGRASDIYEEGHKIKFYWENIDGPIVIPPSKNYIFIGYSFPEENFEQDINFFKSGSRMDTKFFIQNPVDLTCPHLLYQVHLSPS